MTTAREEKKETVQAMTERKAVADYYPTFDSCWDITKKFPLPEGHTLEAAMLIHESEEMVGIVRCRNSIKFYCRRVRLDTLEAKDTQIFNQDEYEQTDEDRLRRHRSIILPGGQLTYTLFRDRERGDFAAVYNIVEQNIKIWDLSGKCLQTLSSEQSKGLGSVLSIDRLNQHQLVSLHEGFSKRVVVWDLATGKVIDSEGRAALYGTGVDEVSNHKITILKDGRIMISNLSGEDRSGGIAIFSWRNRKVEAYTQFFGHFLCEIENGIVVLYGDQIRLLHSETLEATAYSARPLCLTERMRPRVEKPPVAIRQQNGCINLVSSSSRGGLSEIFSPTLESMGEYLFHPSIIATPRAFSNAPFSFYSNGVCLGDLLRYCTQWKADLSKKPEVALVHEHIPNHHLVNIIMDYCVGYGAEDDNPPPKAISLDDLYQFGKNLIACLEDKEKFSPYRNNFIGSLISQPAIHAESKNVLIKNVKNILEEMKESDDTSRFEERLTTYINNFWSALRKGESSRYQASFSEFLQAGRLHQRSVTWYDIMGDGPSLVTERFTVSQLRCLIASSIEKNKVTIQHLQNLRHG